MSLENEKERNSLKSTENNTSYRYSYFYTIVILPTYQSIQIFITLYGIYLLWILLHYTAAHLYIKLCVPYSFYGVILSPLSSSTPQCQGLRWIIYNGGIQINQMWSSISSWICLKIIFYTFLHFKRRF